jgi:hypothetical protein
MPCHSFLFFLTLLLAQAATVEARGLNVAFVIPTIRRSISVEPTSIPHFSSDWSNFDYIDDDEDLEIDTREYVKEEDPQEVKSQVGASLNAPTIEGGYADPIFVPAGSQLQLDEETVLGVLNACREEIGTVFGYSAENRGVGITGGVDFVEMDGPIVVLSLKGRFWHQRTTVLDRVSLYLQQRIPELIDVVIEDEWQLTDEANEQAS